MGGEKPDWTRRGTFCERCAGTVFSGRKDALIALVRAWRQLPGVLAVLFNVVLSIVSHILNLMWARVMRRKHKLDLDSRGMPVVADDAYKYPRTTELFFLAAGCLLGRRVQQVLFPEVDSHVAGACVGLGALIACDRLRFWRRWVRDFLVEVFRVREMRIVETVVGGRLGVPAEKLRVLDFGAGKGMTSAHILKNTAVERVTAIDLEDHPPHVVAYDGATIPYPEASFDLAIALYVFHHIPETRELLGQLRRTAKHVLVFEDLPTESDQPLLSQLFFGFHFIGFGQSFHTHLDRSRREWRGCLAQWGFDVLEEYDVPPTTAIPYRRVGFLLQSRGVDQPARSPGRARSPKPAAKQAEAAPAGSAQKAARRPRSPALRCEPCDEL